MADRRQFGNPRVLQFGDKSAGNQPGDSGHCAQCEAMLADALDGTLSAADQEIFETHMSDCNPCSQMLADARRGSAWLEMLRDPRPEPSAALLERILEQTSGAQLGHTVSHAGFAGAAQAQPLAGIVDLSGFVPGNAAAFADTDAHGKVIPFGRRVSAALRRSQIVLQPRLAMTAAMAFFSIALTMDVTGVRMQDLSASDLRPSSLKRDFYSADAQVVRYYEGLRVVYELESRVHDLQSATDNDTPGSQSTPQSASPDSQASPNGNAPVAQPDQPGPANSPAAPEQRERPRPAPSRPAPNSGTSHRESQGSLRSIANAMNPDSGFANFVNPASNNVSADNSAEASDSVEEEGGLV